GGQRLLRAAAPAAGLYTPPGEARQRARRSLEQGLARALRDAEPGSDHQLAITRALATAVTGEAGGALLQGWLAGEEVPPGLEVDTDLRWLLLTELARLGLADEAAIDAALDRDTTITGQEAAGAAKAARPTRAAKAEAWHLLTEAEDMPNESYRKISRQFVRAGQEELVSRYLEPYLTTAERISAGAGVWQRRGLPLQNSFLGLVFPDIAADDAVVARVQQWLTGSELSDQVSRVVTERCDDAARALRCQQVTGEVGSA